MAGLIIKTKAFWAGRKGVSIFQPLWDFIRLMKKDAVYSKTTSWIFRFAPIASFASVVFASLLNANSNMQIASAFALAIGIAIQNFPEGAAISLPLRSKGEKL